MKKLIYYLPSHFLAATIIGVCIQFYLKFWLLNFTLTILLAFSICVLTFLFFTFKKKRLFTVFSWFLFIAIGSASVYINNSQNYKNHYSKIKRDTSSITIKITKVLKPSFYHKKYEAKVLQVDTIKTIGKILLNINKDSTTIPLNINQKLYIKSSFKDIPPPLNPNTFNYKYYLTKQGIHQQVFLKSNEYLLLPNNTFSLTSYLSSFRTKIQTKLKLYNFTKYELDIINALILGQRHEISKKLRNSYVKAGAIHILAISGLHIGILLLILTKLFQPLDRLKKGRSLKTFLIITTLWLFAIFTGLSASVVRATTMFTFIAIGNSFLKKSTIEHSLITSMLFILLLKPLFLFDVGFQLSYLAVFGIIWIQPLFYKVWKPRYKLVDKIWQLTTVSLAAQVGILPISLYYFHQFPGLFILSNIITIPLLGILLLGGFTITLLALLNILPNFIVVIYSYCIRFINTFIEWVSLQEEFLLTNISMSFLTMLCWYILIIASFLFIINKTITKLIYLLIAIVLTQIIYLHVKFQRNSKEELIVFHKHKNSIIGIRKGKLLSIYNDLDSLSIKENNILTSYKIANNISNNTLYTNKSIHQYKNKLIIAIDSLGIYKIKGTQNPIVLLQYNPKINVTRMINHLKPQQIIVDGTNYKNNVNLWEKTCQKQKTPFWHTGQKGAYIIK